MKNIEKHKVIGALNLVWCIFLKSSKANHKEKMSKKTMTDPTVWVRIIIPLKIIDRILKVIRFSFFGLNAIYKKRGINANIKVIGRISIFR